MRTHFTCAALGVALATGAPVANAQSLVTSPNEFFDSPPSGTLLGPMPMVDVSSGVLQPKQTVETVQTVPAAPPAVRHHVVASHHTTVHQVVPSNHTTVHRVAASTSLRPLDNPAVRHQVFVTHHTTVRRVAASASSRPLYNYVGSAPTVLRVVAAVVVTQAPIAAPGQMPNLSGQFRCVEGCAAGQSGLAFVTRNGWDINLVNELGQPTPAWVDRPGHIWALNWNEGAVYSPDGMTIQFDNGTVWRRNIELLVLPAAPPHGR
jgi:hypothetical protein